ncbi:MAG: ATP-binding cassette domain-containing protein [Candidatus Acetothermia bacterium]|nr:ATP-binding cassette domain-containing protein [Candidatus Acetothermia bacterium]
MLELQGISKTFAVGAERVEALAGVDLALEAGEFVTVIGSNGAGKSTLLNVIAGTCRPARGRVRIAGVDVTRWPAHRRARWIGRVFQDPLRGTAAHMTVAENLALAQRKGRRGLGLPLTQARRRALAAAVAHLGMGLEGRLTERVAHLSGGERQALTVLMATLSGPKILLLDEHTAALDPANADRVLAITARLVREKGIATLMVTHRMDQALQVGDRLIMMHKGRIVLDLGASQKTSLGVEDLVALFKRAGVTDDELLLEAPVR